MSAAAALSTSLDLKVVVGCVISSSSSDFEVQAVLGSGTFGEVAQCRKTATGETVALKVLKEKDCIEEAKHEVTILSLLRRIHCDQFNIVRWNDSFDFQGRFCLEFEKLDISLFEFIERSPLQSLDVLEIRPIVQQLATALEFLGSAGIVHADLKLENIMMVDHVYQPLKVKVIDFGLATYKPAEYTGWTVQTLWYRSPEVMLGTPINEAIDVWSLGCIAAELLLGVVLFPGSDEDDMMRHITSTVGQPSDHQLSTGLHSDQFFSVSNTEEGRPIWSIRPGSGVCHCGSISSLSDLMKVGVSDADEAEVMECDLEAFVDLLTGMLKVDDAERITASQILEHPFISMNHLRGTFGSSFHVVSSMGLMAVPLGLDYGDDDGLDQEAVTSETSDSSSSSSEDGSDPEDDHPADPNISCEQPTVPQNTAITEDRPGRKRKRSADGDSEGGHRSSDPGPASKRRTGAALPGTG